MVAFKKERDIVTLEQKGPGIRWLHISDFHMSGSQSYDADRVLGALCRSLPALRARSGQLDFVIVSGDVALSGKADEYERATALFDRLLSDAEIDKTRLFVVPGNHDVDRSLNSSLSRTLDTPIDADKYFSPTRDLQHVLLRQSGFILWYNSYFDGIRSFPCASTCAPLEVATVRDTPVAILLINSACFSADDFDHGKLLIGRRCIEEALSGSAIDQASFRIAVMHHPLSWLSMVESSNIKALLRDSFDVILSGHLHETDIEQVQGATSGAIHLTAGASYQGSEWPNSAMICHYDGDQVGVLPIQFVDRPRDLWTVDPSVFPEDANFSRSFSISKPPNSSVAPRSGAGAALDGEKGSLSIASRRRDWEDHLFTTPTGRLVYAEPRLMRNPQRGLEEESPDVEAIAISEIASGSNSYVIESGPELGGTNLCRRLLYEFELIGSTCRYYDAREMPNYKKKIIGAFESDGMKLGCHATIILDNFDLERDERLVREISASEYVTRLIIVSTSRNLSAANVDLTSLPYELTRIYLWTISREAVRGMSSVVFDTDDGSLIDGVVTKVYSDLLSLCIPLTPSNVVMYLRVLQREGDFSPINRVHILERYVGESLSRPSDIYQGAFNYKDKIDVIASFVYSLYTNTISEFNDRIWFEFCDRHQRETLKEFDAAELLSELEESRIVYRHGDGIVFRYRFFFNFFLGQFLAARRSLLDVFIDSDAFLDVPGVVEVVTGLGTDNARIVTRLSNLLRGHLGEFENTYAPADFDPLADAVWADEEDEEDKLWKPVQAALEKGPQSTEEIDRLKTSLIAEARTQDQEVRFLKFTELENSLFVVENLLADALRNSGDVTADIKLSALGALFNAELVAFQVGTLFAEQLARRRVFRWGSVIFVDFHKVVGERDPASTEARVAVIIALSHSVAQKIGQQIGTHKLSGVFRAAAASVTDNVGFLDVILFSCVLEARGKDWAKTLTHIIEKTGKNAYYLRLMLMILLDHLSYRIDRVRDVDAMKRLVALIHSKRGHKKQLPGAKLVKRMLGHLEEKEAFKR